VSKDHEFEIKYTDAASYKLNISDLEKLERKCSMNREPVFLVEFRQIGKTYAIVELGYLETLVKF